jgi:hypothetical protein
MYSPPGPTAVEEAPLRREQSRRNKKYRGVCRRRHEVKRPRKPKLPDPSPTTVGAASPREDLKHTCSKQPPLLLEIERGGLKTYRPKPAAGHGLRGLRRPLPSRRPWAVRRSHRRTPDDMVPCAHASRLSLLSFLLPPF